jgi:hypothetical protein
VPPSLDEPANSAVKVSQRAGEFPRRIEAGARMTRIGAARLDALDSLPARPHAIAERRARIMSSAQEDVTRTLPASEPRVGIILVIPQRSVLMCEVNSMSFSRYVVLAAVIGCGVVAASADGGDDKPPATHDAAIKSVVAEFAKNGFKLEKEEEGNYWVVADPKGDGYDVIVAWRTWPAKATEEEMRAELKMINLGFLLNAPARVAMSKPGLRSADPVKKLPPLDQVPVVAKLEKLFKDYKPPEPKK